MVMLAQQWQDILLYCSKGFNTKQTRDVMLLEKRKLHDFQTYSVPSLGSIQRVHVRYTKHGATEPTSQRARQPTMTTEQAEAISESGSWG
jgi:hypothetical protein